MATVVRGARVQRKGAGGTAAAASPAATTANAASSASVLATPVPAPDSAPGQSSSQVHPSTSAAGVNAAVSSAPSSIVRPRPSGAGIRAWINGLYLSSSGIRSLDSLLGGGLPLGSITAMIEEGAAVGAEVGVERGMTNATVAVAPFMQAFMGDGIAYGQRCMLISPAPTDSQHSWLKSLPHNRTMADKERKADDARAAQAASNTPSDDWSATSDQSVAASLHIAWRYKQYMEKPMDARANIKPSERAAAAAIASRSSASSTSLSCSYDFHSTISPTLLDNNMPHTVSMIDDIRIRMPTPPQPPQPSSVAGLAPHVAAAMHAAECEEYAHRCDRLVYRHVLSEIKRFLEQSQTKNSAPQSSSAPVSRILLQAFGGAGWRGAPPSYCNTPPDPRNLLLFLMHLRQLAAQYHTLILIHLCAASFTPSVRALLSHYCHTLFSFSMFSDAALSLSSLTASTFGDYDGLLRVQRSPLLHSLVSLSGGGGSSSAEENGNFLVKRTRRAVCIDRFSLPPEESREDETQHKQQNKASTGTPTGGLGTSTSLDMEESGMSLSQGSSNLPRRHIDIQAEQEKKRQARHALANDPVMQIVRGRQMGCSGSHQLPGKMDF